METEKSLSGEETERDFLSALIFFPFEMKKSVLA